MIGVTKVRDLTLAQRGGDESSKHISAASSLVRRGDLLFVVADDALQLGVFPAEGEEHGYLVEILPGHLSPDSDERKKEKADLEALTAVGAFGSHEHGALLIFGSGSGAKRDRGGVIPLGEDGRPTGDHRGLDLEPLYRAVAEKAGKTNVEGAVNWGEDLVLLNRGNDPEAANACVVLNMERTLDTIANDSTLTPDLIEEIRLYDPDLGQHRGPQLCFSDASPLSDGRVVFSASTEDTVEGSDGKTEGSAIGILDRDRNVAFLEPIDRIQKVEGITAREIDDCIEVLMVVDADDPQVPSPLLRAVI
jgi:hypothetical protein